MSGLLFFIGVAGIVFVYWTDIVATNGRTLPHNTLTSKPHESGSGSTGGWILTSIVFLLVGSSGASLVASYRIGRELEAAFRDEFKKQAEGVAALQAAQVRLAAFEKAEAGWTQQKSDLERRFAALAASRNQLQAELDGRKQAERNLTEQTQSFARTASVLELHVKARTEQLQDLQHRYEGILNSAGEGICGLDARGQIIFANPAAAKITGWSVEELIGKVESQELGRHYTRDGAATDADGTSECEFFHKDGSAFLVERTRTRIFDGDRIVGAVVVFKDITERKRAEEQLAEKATELERSNAELEQFAFVASHDLQEPLRKIQAFADRLKTKCSGLELGEGWDYLERMQSASVRMQRLINDLLTFSRVIRTSHPFEPVDLNTIVKEVLTDLELRIEQSKAVITTEPMPTIDADPTQMRQLFLNLIGNALKFQPAEAQPRVAIRARAVGDRSAKGDTALFHKAKTSGNHEPTPTVMELSVEDNGIGFDEKYTERIFAVFQRLHGRSEYEGTGVGLAVCRRIAERHGGSIAAKSAPGQGATFAVILPLKQKIKAV